MKSQLLIAAVSLVALAGVATAKDKTMSKDKTATTDQGVSFDSLDANKDGRISMPEASADAKLVEVFSTADKNGDGYLDEAEFNDAAKTARK